MITTKPLLSICIPTFNRAELLEVCLATVVPQLIPLAQEVECIISDNASPDHTAQVVDRFSKIFPIRYYRNQFNIGIIANITRCTSELAAGDYVLLIGDDDALTEGAVSRMLDQLRLENSPDMIALNVGYRPRDQRPAPDNAMGGVSVRCDRTLRKSAIEGRIPFEEVLEGPTADLTASYSVVLRRSLWRQMFPEACFDQPFSSVRTTYPSAWVIAKSMPGKPAIAIATPSVVIYELPGDEYSWARFRALSSLVYATQLLLEYQQAGVPLQILRPYFIYQLEHRSAELGDLLWNRESAGGWRAAVQFAWMMRSHPLRLLKMLILACNHSLAPRSLRWPVQASLRIKQRLRGQS